LSGQISISSGEAKEIAVGYTLESCRDGIIVLSKDDGPCQVAELLGGNLSFKGKLGEGVSHLNFVACDHNYILCVKSKRLTIMSRKSGHVSDYGSAEGGRGMPWVVQPLVTKSK